jgi:hypothetical protein
LSHIEGPHKLPKAGDFRPESWRDVLWLLLLMTAVGLVVLVWAAFCV